MAEIIKTNETTGEIAVQKGYDNTLAIREAKQVEAQVIMAKKFPRDIIQVEEKIKNSCKRESLAEIAQYAVPRAGTSIKGPSIRLAEELARQYGNCDIGYKIVESDTEAELVRCMAWCWDLENNLRVTKEYEISAYQYTKNGNKKRTSDDLTLAVNAGGSKALRDCILRVVPSDLTDTALDTCEHTLKNSKVPISEQIDKMLRAFEKLNVDEKTIQIYLQLARSKWTNAQIHSLRKVHTAIKNGDTTIDNVFFPNKDKEEEIKSLSDKQIDELLMLPANEHILGLITKKYDLAKTKVELFDVIKKEIGELNNTEPKLNLPD